MKLFKVRVDFREWQIDFQPRVFGEARFFLHPEHSGWKEN